MLINPKRRELMQIDVVEIPEQFKDKSVDGPALMGYLEDVKTMLDSAVISGNDHPLVQKTQTLMMLVQLLWNEKEGLKGKLIETTESLDHMTEKYKDLLARYDRHLDEDLAAIKELREQMMVKDDIFKRFALQP